MLKNIKKLVQRQLYDILSQKSCFILLTLCTFVLILTIIHFGEVVLQWKYFNYMSKLQSFSDNLQHKSLQENLCAPVPIDFVYTWVNGSDLNLIDELHLLRYKMTTENTTHGYQFSCTYLNCFASQFMVASVSFYQRLNLSNFCNKESNFSLNGFNFVIMDCFSSTKAQNLSFIYNSFKLSEDVFEQAFITTEVVQPFVFKLENAFLIENGNSLKSKPLNNGKPLTARNLVIKYFADFVTDVFGDPNNPIIKFNCSSVATIFRQQNNVTINPNVKIKDVFAIWNWKEASKYEAMSSSRFEDNDELRYSLRAVEKFAPWAHHIFLVTNGQVPSWLDLNNPRISIVTHEEIFTNLSHLPTFSSPAIESHVHRIAGLSRRFVYFNDDVFLGAPVYPEDFYSKSSGYKVYLSWPVPECAVGCPNNWIQDGYCDRSCNNSACGWDGTDCINRAGRQRPNSWDSSRLNTFNQAHLDFCHMACADHWLADRYCDTPCNVAQCGFDCGDCGDIDLPQLDNVLQLPSLEANWTIASPKVHVFRLPRDATVVVLNASQFLISLQDGQLDHAEYEILPKSAVIRVRSAALALKYSTIHFVLKNHSDIKENVVIRVRLHSKSVVDRVNITTECLLLFNLPTSVVQLGKNFISKSAKSEMLFVTSSSSSSTSTNLNLTYAWSETFPLDTHIEPRNIVNESSWRMNSTDLAWLLNLFEEQETLIAMPFTVLPSSSTNSSGFFSWERAAITLLESESSLLLSSSQAAPTQRRLLSAYEDSLRYTNRLLNQMYAVHPRKVPGHMPHMIDKLVMHDLQEKFAREWQRTSEHKLRAADDLQFALVYFYFLIHESRNYTLMEVFSMLDSNADGYLDTTEFRTLVTKLDKSPHITDQNIVAMYGEIQSCNSSLFVTTDVNSSNSYNTLSTKLSFAQLQNCSTFAQRLLNAFGLNRVYNVELQDDSELWFKMLSGDVKTALHHLDELRRAPARKFICLNDDGVSRQVREAVREYLHFSYPLPSQFELPDGQENPPGVRIHMLKSIARTKEVNQRAFMGVLFLLSLGFVVHCCSARFRRLKIIRNLIRGAIFFCLFCFKRRKSRPVKQRFFVADI